MRVRLSPRASFNVSIRARQPRYAGPTHHVPNQGIASSPQNFEVTRRHSAQGLCNYCCWMTQPVGNSRERCAWTQQLSDRLEVVTLPAVDWLGRSSGTVAAHVLPEYAPRLRRYAELRRRYSRLSFPVALILIAILVAMAVLGRPDLMGATLLVMASLMWAFPFATQQTVEVYGVGRSIDVTRVGAVLVAAIGLWYLLRSAL